MRRVRTSISLLLALSTAVLAACGITKAPILQAGGSGIEGSGLNDRRPRSPLERLLTEPAPQIGVLALSGEALAGRPLKTGDRFATDAVFELRSGTARLQLPGETIVSVTGPARVQFSLVDGLLAPELLAGQIQSATAGRIATPGISALVCDGGFRAARSNTITNVDCSSGTVRWSGVEALQSLSGSPSWSVDETQRRITRR